MSEVVPVLVDTFDRVREVVHEAVEGLDDEQLAFRPAPDANSIAWLVWHLTRVQDDHFAGLAGDEQVWTKGGWARRFALPFDDAAHGYGQTSAEVAAVRASADLLLGYHDDVHARTCEWLVPIAADGLDRVVDERWDPPVTAAVRIVSVAADTLQHAGQAAYVRGLLSGS